MPDGLHPPLLLVAMPQVLDPFFHKSVVLLVHHDDEEGSLGFIVNRPTGIRVGEILSGMEIRWSGEEGAMAHFGGPVQPQIGTILFSPEAREGGGRQGGSEEGGGNGDEAGGEREDGAADGEEEESAATEVAAGVSLTQHVKDLARLASLPPARFRLLLGYAGWGSGQLLEEILRNDWLTAPVSPELIFDVEPEQIWTTALRSVGVDPDSLPSWTPTGDEEAAN